MQENEEKMSNIFLLFLLFQEQLKVRLKRKFFIFNFFHDFIFLMKRKIKNTPFHQISASLNEEYEFYRQTKENNRKIREQKKNLYF